MTPETPSPADVAPGSADTVSSPADAAPSPADIVSSPAEAVPSPSDPMPSPVDVAGRDPSGMEHRNERIRIETARHRIVGSVRLARDGYRSRVSDVLNAPERDFLTLTEATIEPLDGGPVELHAFLTVARRHIVFAVAAPEE